MRQIEVEQGCHLDAPVLERELAGLRVELCNAVAAIHAFKVGHGDLHERNVIITGPIADILVEEYDTLRWRPVVIDFENMTFTAPAEQEEAARTCGPSATSSGA